MRRGRWGQRVLGPVAGMLFLAGCEITGVGGEGGAGAPFAEDRPGLALSVVDEAGAPVAGAYVTVSPGAWEGQSGDDGTVSFGDLDVGAFSVTVSGQGYATATSSVELSTADAALSVTLTASPDPGTTLAGLVTDAGGAAVEAATIWLDGAEIATTDADGAFEATGLSAGDHAVQVQAPAGSSLLTWDIPSLTLTDGARATIDVALGGGAPSGATFIGSSSCLACHTDLDEVYSASAHANAARDPLDVEDEAGLSGLYAAFFAGDAVDIDDLGAKVALSVGSDGAWRATVSDAYGSTTDAMEVVEVYGGHRTGAALVVEAGGTEALLPVSWALAGQGLGSAQDAAGWVSAWTDGWFDGDGRLALDGAGRPGADASFALQCAGCHNTGGALAESGGAFEMRASSLARSVEDAVGCESCHGPGSAHASSTLANEIMNPGDLPTGQRIEVCARCHERSTPTDHPFSETPGFPVTSDGELLGPTDTSSDYASAAPTRWLDASASRLGWDQVGDLRVSPHLTGEQGYDASCEDCHSAHGSDHAASLRADPTDNTLCTGCHAADFPDEAAESSHSHHNTFHPGSWSPGACTGCHMPRMGVSVRVDAVSGAGELRAHSLDFIEPGASLAEFDAAGASVLDLGQAPVPACLDCHLQADAAADDEDTNCPCPVGSARKRSTYEDFQTVYELVWGVE